MVRDVQILPNIHPSNFRSNSKDWNQFESLQKLAPSLVESSPCRCRQSFSRCWTTFVLKWWLPSRVEKNLIICSLRWISRAWRMAKGKCPCVFSPVFKLAKLEVRGVMIWQQRQTMHQNEGKSIKNTHLESETSIYKCLFQLDDEPNRFSLENRCLIKHPF